MVAGQKISRQHFQVCGGRTERNQQRFCFIYKISGNPAGFFLAVNADKIQLVLRLVFFQRFADQLFIAFNIKYVVGYLECDSQIAGKAYLRFAFGGRRSAKNGAGFARLPQQAAGI